MAAPASNSSAPASYMPHEPETTAREVRENQNAGVDDRNPLLTHIINCGERFRSGERISSAMAESTVNAVVSKRFAKRQQMQWTRRGTHLLLQTRTCALDGTLRPMFERWYPGLANDNPASTGQAAAA